MTLQAAKAAGAFRVSRRRPRHTRVDRWQSPATAAAVRRVTSESSDQQQYHHDDQDQADAATGVVAPGAAVAPSRQCADQKQNQQDQQNCAKHVASSLADREPANAASVRLLPVQPSRPACRTRRRFSRCPPESWHPGLQRLLTGPPPPYPANTSN